MSAQNYEFGSAIGHFFKVFGRKPVATLWVILWNTALMSAAVGLIFWAVAPAYLNMFDMALNDVEPSGEQVLEMLGPIFLVMPLMMVGGILTALLAQGAWLRLLVRGEVAAIIPFRLGGDELRLFVVNLVMLALLVALEAVFFGLMITIAVASGLQESGDGFAAAATMGGILLLAVPVFLIALLYFGIRFAAAPALTIYDRRIRIFDAWPATKGIFWWLLLTYLVVAVIMIIADTVFGTMIQMAFLGAFLPDIFQFFQSMESGGDPTAWLQTMIEQLRQPEAVGIIAIGVGLTIFLQTLYKGYWHSVGAYAAIRHRTVDDTDPVASQADPAPATIASTSTGDAEANSGSTAPAAPDSDEPGDKT